MIRQVRSRLSESEIQEVTKVLKLLQHRKIKSNYDNHKITKNKSLNGWMDCHPLFYVNKKVDLVIIYRYEGKYLVLRSIGTHSEVGL